MSLELAIQENTAAIRELIAIMSSNITPTLAQVDAAIAESEAQAEPVEEAPAPVEKKRGRVKPEIRDEAPAPSVFAEPAPAPAAAPVTYQECANSITKLAAAKGRQAAAEVLKQFGVAKLPEAKPEQYADIKAAAEAGLA